MRIKDFKTKLEDTVFDVQCELLSAQCIKGSGKIEYTSQNQFKLFGKIDDDIKIFSFSVLDQVKLSLLIQHLQKKQFNICFFETVGSSSTTFFLHVAFFYSVIRDTSCNIILSEKVKKSLFEKRKIRALDNFENDIFRNFNIESDNDYAFAYTNGFYNFEDDNSSIDTGMSSDEELIDDEFADPDYASEKINKTKGLKIFGKEYNLCVSIKQDSQGDYFYAEAVDYNKKVIPSLSIWITKISFKDERTYISEKIKEEINSKPGYLKLWDEYSSLEGNMLLEKARKIGQFHTKETVEYDPIKEDGKVVKNLRRLKPIGLSDEAFDLLREGDILDISNDIPIYLKNVNMNWDEYQIYKNTPKETVNLIQENQEKANKEITVTDSYVIERKVDDYFLIDDKNTGKVIRGIVTLSIGGDEAQINRRAHARNLIANADCEMPALGLLIEGKFPDDLNIEKNIPEHKEPITPFVENKLFLKNVPTLVQRKAIDIALNTPDIAVIQGPPGTGKTTVIRAIIERLNEDLDKNTNNTGEVLVTSFQHAAVLNIREKLSVNSFPTPKFGTKDLDNDEDSYENIVNKWCESYSEKLRKRNPDLKENPDISMLKELHRNYLSSPSTKNLDNFIKFVKIHNSKENLHRLLEELENDELNKKASVDLNLIPYIRRLRTTKSSFIDDGSDTADSLLVLLEPILDKSNEMNRKILNILDEVASRRNTDISDELLNKLSEIKDYLLKRCIPKPIYIKNESNEIINQIYLETLEQLKQPKAEVTNVLFSLLNEFENNSERIFDVISKYNFVFSATCQQSDGHEIIKAKKKYSAHLSYDTVIVDEAARVNPGDLMIPISKARNKIILVGDHRQLPHIYDEELAETLMSTSNSFERKYIEANLKMSMFEYLLEKAKELTAKDNIQRVITLDYQFRMHPLLGNFINENFYKNHNLEESFKSPSGDKVKDYEQGLFYKPIYWKNIPNKDGTEEKSGTTRVRKVEVNFIVKKIEEYILNEIEENKIYLNKTDDEINEFLRGNSSDKYDLGLTYGVISFYSGQKKLLSEAIKTLRDKYKNKESIVDKIIFEKLRRVKIGSVDEFQGMEFDIIFLSIVRSHNVLLKQNDDDSEDSEDKLFGIRNYGFLVSENRLCVALSRQKKLLVIVGDAELFSGEEWLSYAEKYVPAMANLYKLCEKENVIING